MKDPMFIVWNPQGSNPKYQHRSFSSADEEAKRLARANPGQSFFVMQALRVATRTDLIVEDFDNALVPF